MLSETPPAVHDDRTGQRTFINIQTVMIALVVGYVMVGLFMYGLGFNFMQGDTLLYWNDSSKWQSIFNPDYLPLYLPLLALLRTITFGLIPATGLMMMVNIVALVAGAWFIYHIAKSSGAGNDMAALGAMLYGLWPLVGLPYTVYPRFDVPPIMLFLGGLYFLQNRRVWAGAGLTSLALIGHKAVAPIGALSLVVCLLTIKPRLAPIKLAGALAIGFAPLVLLWLGGTIIHGTPVWLFAWNVGVQVVSRSDLPILDGAVGTFLRGTLGEIIKGIVLAGLAAFAAWLGVLCLRNKPSMYLVGTIICGEIVLLWLTLNQFEIWAMARFSRLLALPLLWVASDYFKAGLPASGRWRVVFMAGLLGLILSQFVYAWYMVKVFYA